MERDMNYRENAARGNGHLSLDPELSWFVVVVSCQGPRPPLVLTLLVTVDNFITRRCRETNSSLRR